MKRLLISPFLLILLNCANINAQTIPFEKTTNGLIIPIVNAACNNKTAVKIDILTDEIVHIQEAPQAVFSQENSLIAAYPAQTNVFWKARKEQQKVVINTKSLIIEVNQNTGLVSFFDKDHKKIVAEKQTTSCNFEQVTIEGTNLYKLSKSFQTTATEGWYGLGQHQQGIMNYKGRQVVFFQNNTEVAIPFLLSSNHYGLIWDNYSHTRAGSLKAFLPLNSLKLFAKNGTEGWLDAAYSNDKLKPEDIQIERVESEISMPFLGDSKVKLPKDFKPETGVVTWQGSIASPFTGMHQLKFIMGGNLKVWINNKLILDRWRKAWNPVQIELPLNLVKEEKYAIKIEWIPEGGESYLSAEWQPPLTEQEKSTFSFASEAGKQISYYFLYGNNMDNVIANYRFVTGKAPIVPKWALGFWQSRERYKTQDEIISTIDEFRKRKIPIDNIVLDWSYWKEAEWGSQEFDASRFASPDSMIQQLHNQYKAQLMISVWPKFYEGIKAYNDFYNNGWLYPRNVADRQRDWIAQGYISTFYDAFNASARKGFWELINQKLFKKGIDAWWMDASEPDILSNVSPAKRILQITPNALGTGAEFLNAYPLQNAKGIYEGQRATSKNQRVFLLTRSAFAGSQRYAATVWSGDIGSTWDDMKHQIAAGANFSMSGLPYWTMDIGGFVVPEKFEKQDTAYLEEWRELNARWQQFGAFVPLFRAHGQFPFREIYHIAPEQHIAYKNFLFYDQLRYRLLPYIYSLAGAAYHQDYTIMRGLVMDFADDSNVLNINDQYLFGPSFLVNPVYQFKQRNRNVYLPKCKGWYDFYTGQFFEGGKTIAANAPYDQMPLFVKAGAIVPFGPDLQYTTEKKADTIQLHIYTGADGQFILYEDEGTNYNYEQGKFATIKFDWDDKRNLLHIGENTGVFEGQLKYRIFKMKLFKPFKAMPFELDKSVDQIVKYNGQKLDIQF
jgi:alpha-D-xyloside xylohydrolase